MILFGKPVSEFIYKKIEKEIALLRKSKIIPAIGVVLVGNDPASLIYVKMKEKIAIRLGIDFQLFHLPGIVPEKTVENLVHDLNLNKYVSGIVVQLPLPQNFKSEKILKKIVPAKDVDGFYSDFKAPTAQAILEILKFYQITLKNKKIVLVGRGRLVGQPLEKILIEEGYKPIVCDSATRDLASKTRSADIIVAATGVSWSIKPEMVKEEAVIIDAGSAESKGKIVGDIAPETYQKVQAYSPVPGGVGPVTVAILMRNVVEATKK